MQMTDVRRCGYYLAFTIACVFFCVHLVNPSAGRQDDLIRVTLAIVIVVTLYITQTDKDYLVRSIPLRALMFFAAALGLTSVFLRP